MAFYYSEANWVEQPLKAAIAASDFRYSLSKEDIEFIKEIIIILEPFEEITLLVSGEKYVTGGYATVSFNLPQDFFRSIDKKK